MPRSSMTIIASGTVSRIDCRCASRASASRVITLARTRLRCSSSPPQDTPMPMTAKATPLSQPQSKLAGASVDQKEAPTADAQRGRQQARPKAADPGRNQHRRHEIKKTESARQDRRQHIAHSVQRNRDRRDGP